MQIKNVLLGLSATADEQQMLEALVKHHPAHAHKEAAVYNKLLIWLYKVKEI